MTGRILSAPRLNEGWIPASAGMTKDYARYSLRGNDGGVTQGPPSKGRDLLGLQMSSVLARSHSLVCDMKSCQFAIFRLT